MAGVISTSCIQRFIRIFGAVRTRQPRDRPGHRLLPRPDAPRHSRRYDGAAAPRTGFLAQPTIQLTGGTNLLTVGALMLGE